MLLCDELLIWYLLMLLPEKFSGNLAAHRQTELPLEGTYACGRVFRQR